MPNEPVSLSPAKLQLIRLFLGAACFLSGGAIMVIEISAYRLLAPLFGSSVYTWTALIGIVLISFSAGGWIGGRLADRRMALDVLGWLLAGAAVLTFFVRALHLAFGEGLSHSDSITGSIVLSLLLFAVPGALLGAVSPAAVRFYSLTQKDTHVGAAAGTISMLGSLGSFVGTFLSGFVLLSHFGVRSIFIGTAVLLLVLALLAFTLAGNTLKQQLPIILSGLLAGVIGGLSKPKPGADVIYEHETFYHRLEVSEKGEGPNKQRILRLDNTVEGGMNPDTGALILGYQHFWRLALLQDAPKISSALFIGAGAFGMPEELSREFPEATVDVAEIDPAVIDAGRAYFKLNDHPRVNAYAEDARRFLLSRREQKWDFIFGDAYNGIRQIPPHLASKEFFELVSQRLNPKGIFVMNVITAVQGPRAELLAGMLATLRQVFPHVETFSIGGPRQQAQNVILLASHEDWKPFITDRLYASGSLNHRLASAHVPSTQLPTLGQVFTDDYNPVDAIIARGLLME